ncbi:MAG: class I SAM-dependent methyltransferase [Gammaproteobacteria bacterium]
MRRIPEPELMLEEAQVRAYAEADFAEAHDLLIALLRARTPGLAASGTALDLGCGAGDVARRFARALPGWRVHGIDGSPAMLSIAGDMTRSAQLSERVSFGKVLLPAAPPAAARYDLAFSNSLLHHLDDPDVFWSALRDWSQPGGRIFAMDLLRPESRARAEALVRKYAAGEPEVLQTDFFNSLLAAYEKSEVEEQLSRVKLDRIRVEIVSDRHWIAWGTIGQP